MLRLALICAVLSACTDDDSTIVKPPFTGTAQRFIVDGFALPHTNQMARDLAVDLGGTDTDDNTLGLAIATLFNQGLGRDSFADLFASGALATSIEVQADDLDTDPTVGVTWFVRDGAAARVLGGGIVDGTFHANAVLDTPENYAGQATLALPILPDADPLPFALRALQITLVPDGNGGYDGRLNGIATGARETARRAIVQQLDERPELHRNMWRYADQNSDGLLPPDEFVMTIIGSILSPDLDNDGSSIGIGFHASPCAGGTCATTAVLDTCTDRVMDGDEVATDCGGSCGACGTGLACTSGQDCQSGTCTANTCTAPRCDDGIKNGLEADVDCGGACVLRCATRKICGYDADCASGHCSTGNAGVGVCL